MGYNILEVILLIMFLDGSNEVQFPLLVTDCLAKTMFLTDSVFSLPLCFHFILLMSEKHLSQSAFA